MNRGIVLGALVSTAVLTLTTSACQQSSQEVPKVVGIQKVRDNLYVMSGGGGNTAIFVTQSGVVVVDTKLEGWGQAMLDKIRTVTDKPVTTIINTHSHHDHVGNNLFAGTRVDIVAQEITSRRMKGLELFQGEKANGLPNRVFADRTTLMSGPDQIDLYYFGVGHTEGDAWVVFPSLRAMHAGDMFPERGTPVLDKYSGGSGVAMPETLTRAESSIKDVDTIITGHGRVMTWNDFKLYVEFNRDFLSWTKEQITSGKNIDEAADAYVLPAKYTGYSSPSWRVKENIKVIYMELTGDVPRASWWSRLKPFVER